MSEHSKQTCLHCGSTRLKAVKFEETYRPRGKSVVVKLQGTECQSCGHQSGTMQQHDQNLQRLAARKVHYDGLLMGEEIVALRQRYGLTQVAAAKVFGKGKIAFSRYENEASYPDEGTTLMLQAAIEMPRFIKWLADRAGVELPLWKQRMRDDAAVRRALREMNAEKLAASAAAAVQPERRKTRRKAESAAHP